MNIQPVSYKQYDSRWASEPYRTTGESSTIKSAGCGPSCAAMVIATLKDKSVTPKTCCDWSMAHGYKALNQGTYYSYFVPQFKEYGLSCHQLAKGAYEEAMSLLKQGYYIIALMGKGLWTSGGHFVLVWWQDDKVRINDPASTSDARQNGDPSLFKAQAKYFWAIDAREFNKNGKAQADTVKGGTVTVNVSVLKKGSTGGNVKALQALLTGFGYNCGTVDGDFGTKTYTALCQYQKDMGLQVDGSCGPKTWSCLLGV